MSESTGTIPAHAGSPPLTVEALRTRAAAAYPAVVADPAAASAGAAALVEECRAAGDPESLVLALRALAWAERTRLAETAAKHLLDEAAAVARRHRLGLRLGEVLTSRGAVNLELGRVRAARQDLQRAETLMAGGGTPQVWHQQAALLHNLGDLAAAERLYRRVVAAPDAGADVLAKVWNNLALIDIAWGRVDAAYADLASAGEAADRAGPALVAIVAQTRGWVTVQTGRLAESLRQFDRAAGLYRSAGLPLGEHYLEYVDALVDLRLLPEALRMSRRAVRQFEAAGVPLMAAEAGWRLARLALLTGAHDDAQTASAAAADTFRSQRRRAWAARCDLVRLEARVLAGRATQDDVAALRRAARTLVAAGLASAGVEAHLVAGRAGLAAGRTAWALQDLGRARDLARGGPVLVRLNGRVAGALAAQALGARGPALRHCRAGLADLARHRAGLGSMELRALASGHGTELGRLGLSLALGSGSAVRSLEWMERTRAAALVVVQRSAPEDAADAAPPAALERLRRLRGELAGAGGPQAAPTDLLRRLRTAEEEVRREGWGRAAEQPEPLPSAAPAPRDVVPVSRLRGALGDRTLVEYAAVDGEVVAVVLTARQARLVRLGPVARVTQEMESALFALRRLAVTSGRRVELARSALGAGVAALADQLVAPLGLAAGAELVVVPPAVLQRAPWTALHPGPVAVSPSASLWERTRGHDDRGGPVALVCGPGLDGAAQEVAALRALYPDATALLPPDSTVGRVALAMSGAGLVHLACHGQVRSDNPTFSALQLSDGPLTVHEMDLRGLAPRRVVLAACDSGADVAYEGNEMLGFVSALFARGASGVVASIVSIPDLGTDALMLALHRRLQAGDPCAAALHAARSTLDLADPRSYANWCSFTAYGGG